MLVTFYSSNYEHDPATFYQGCGSLKSQKDDLSNTTKLVLSQVWWLDVAICTPISSVRLLSCVQLFVTPCIAACQASLSITNSQSLLKLMSMERVMTSNISSAVVPFSSLLHPFQLIIKIFSSESVFRIRWPKYGVSVSTSVLPKNTQDWTPLGWTGWISLQSKGFSRGFSNTTVQKHQFFGASLNDWI